MIEVTTDVTWDSVCWQAIANLPIGSNVLEVGASVSPICKDRRWPSAQCFYHVLDINLARVRRALPELPKRQIFQRDLHSVKGLDNAFDLVICIDVLEHVERPWDCAKQLVKITKPLGYLMVVAPFSWRHHPCPIDYWRFSPQGLESLFVPETQTLVKGFDYSARRRNMRGFWPSGEDAPPIDNFGGWRENVESFLYSRKI